MHEPLAATRRWFAEDIRVRAPVLHDAAVIEAFATVPREKFLGPGPWRLLATKPFTTPDSDPRWLYHDLVVVIDAERRLNNGQPSFWAQVLDALPLRPGERVLQVGAGTGYYTAIIAEIVGRGGRVTAVEYETELAARARGNLADWPQVEVVAGDGCTHDAGEVDAIIACAGATHPAPLWLDRLAEGGRLALPLTGTSGWGFVLRAERQGQHFAAASISGVGIYNCMGGRDEEAAGQLQGLVNGLRGEPPPIVALHRGAHAAEAAEKVWFGGPGFWLERRSEAGPGDDT
jgi:protein-L-isoaspartate(D-aspartate) O-methyltransferase